MLTERKKDVHATNSNLLNRFLFFFFGGRGGASIMMLLNLTLIRMTKMSDTNSIISKGREALNGGVSH